MIIERILIHVVLQVALFIQTSDIKSTLRDILSEMSITDPTIIKYGIPVATFVLTELLLRRANKRVKSGDYLDDLNIDPELRERAKEAHRIMDQIKSKDK